jgi:hypothetical protein
MDTKKCIPQVATLLYVSDTYIARLVARNGHEKDMSLEEIVSKSTLLCGDRTQENA